MQCKCTESINCNPCTNTTRFLDICPECFLLGHHKIQSKTVAGTTTIRLEKKAE